MSDAYVSILNPESRIHVAGHTGLVGSAVVRELTRRGYGRLLTPTRNELDLRDARAVADYYAAQRPDAVLLAAAKVGGIHANATQPGDFIRDNLQIQVAVIEAARAAGVRRFVFLGSACIYPRETPQPIREEYLLTGELEPTNQAYAVAKIAGLEMCRAYRRQYGFDAVCAMPTNLYGPGDTYDLEHGHVLPALLRRMHEAKLASAEHVAVWGSGRARRDFLYVDDAAAALAVLLEHPEPPEVVNVGSGEAVAIAEAARLVAQTVGFAGRLAFDAGKPDGAPVRMLESSRMRAMGWRPRVDLAEGLSRAYAAFLAGHGRGLENLGR